MASLCATAVEGGVKHREMYQVQHAEKRHERDCEDYGNPTVVRALLHFA